MPQHRLDYGSMNITWLAPGSGRSAASVQVCVNCTCGAELYGQGATFSEAYNALHLNFARHLTDSDAGDGGSPMA